MPMFLEAKYPINRIQLIPHNCNLSVHHRCIIPWKPIDASNISDHTTLVLSSTI